MGEVIRILNPYLIVTFPLRIVNTQTNILFTFLAFLFKFECCVFFGYVLRKPV
ncbi:putative membrane protein [Enterobacter hormaechei]|nr:hypothetical protein L416_03900 [Enterobacter hormaechei]OUE97213.1 hypothetical protein AZZ90_002308 [Enterobacter hormaechei]PRW23937.1 putative membrane protein [Enterobacter hormaechei]RAL74411.1 putative membrane protein [Enterobacter hormaechei]